MSSTLAGKTPNLVDHILSSSSGAYSSSSSSFVAVTNLSVTVTATGRPIYVGLVPDATANVSYLNITSGTNTGIVEYKIKRDSTDIAVSSLALGGTVWNTISRNYIPVGALNTIDIPSAGSYTYTVEGRLSGFGSSFQVYYAKLVAIRL